MAQTKGTTKIIAWAVVVIVVLAIFESCRPHPAPIANAASTPKISREVPAVATIREIHASELGADWPLIAMHATIACEPLQAGSLQIQAVTVGLPNGQIYGLNGIGQGTKHLPALPDSEWRDDSNVPGAKVDIGPLIQAARSLCPNI